MAKAPSLSLCMIVRDEEERLPRCLESARRWVDEIIVVDTGSTDGTVAVAESFGARVLQQEWTDDFSVARNRSLDEATGSWALILDADEVLSPEAGEDLRRIARNGKAVCATMTVRCDEADDEQTLSSMVRAFRLRPDIRYRYRLHEQVLPDILRIVRDEGLIQETCAGEIHHDGYLPELVEARGKNERNLRLYDLQLQDTPDDLYVMFKYADFARRFPERAGDCRQVLERAYAALQDLDRERLHELTFTGQVCALLGEALQRTGDAARAFEITSFGVERCAHTPDLWYVHGNGALACGDAGAAEEAFTECHAWHERPGAIATMPHITDLGARLGLARARFVQGWDEEAFELATAVLDDHARSDDALNLWVEICSRLGRFKELVARMSRIVTEEPERGLAWGRCGEALYNLGMDKQALPWLMRSSELLEEDAWVRMLQGECFMGLGLAEEAAEAFEAGQPHRGCMAGLIVLHLLCRLDPETALDPEDQGLITLCRRMLDRIRTRPDHPFREQLAAAEAWLETGASQNGPFLEQTVCAAV